MLVLYSIHIDFLTTLALHEAEATVVALSASTMWKALESWAHGQLIDPYLLLDSGVLVHSIDMVLVVLFLLERDRAVLLLLASLVDGMEGLVHRGMACLT